MFRTFFKTRISSVYLLVLTLLTQIGSYKRAVHLFRQELHLTRGLLDALKRVGYRENQRVLTPRQVQVIEEYLGEP
ncbi:MAG: DUF4248 domain-containing protein [Bacteroidaceae bacterium]|nr:DUF4248 domain-containing protein [Bacteroidaceae bacterium]